jgi:hypothetical protein
MAGQHSGMTINDKATPNAEVFTIVSDANPEELFEAARNVDPDMFGGFTDTGQGIVLTVPHDALGTTPAAELLARLNTELESNGYDAETDASAAGWEFVGAETPDTETQGQGYDTSLRNSGAKQPDAERILGDARTAAEEVLVGTPDVSEATLGALDFSNFGRRWGDPDTHATGATPRRIKAAKKEQAGREALRGLGGRADKGRVQQTFNRSDLSPDAKLAEIRANESDYDLDRALGTVSDSSFNGPQQRAAIENNFDRTETVIDTLAPRAQRAELHEANANWRREALRQPIRFDGTPKEYVKHLVETGNLDTGELIAQAIARTGQSRRRRRWPRR